MKALSTLLPPLCALLFAVASILHIANHYQMLDATLIDALFFVHPLAIFTLAISILFFIYNGRQLPPEWRIKRMQHLYKSRPAILSGLFISYPQADLPLPSEQHTASHA